MKRPSKYCEEWCKRFAYFPTEVNGQTFWLEFYESRYVRKDNNCKCEVIGWWELREIPAD